MKAMILESAGVPLQLVDCPVPEPGANEVLLKVHACGVCRTDLHIVDGELKEPKPRLIPGHEIVGTVTASGSEVADFHIGDRVGVPWLAPRAEPASIATAGAKTCVTGRFLPAIPETAGMQVMPSPMHASVSLFPAGFLILRRRLSCAPGSPRILLCDRPAASPVIASASSVSAASATWR